MTRKFVDVMKDYQSAQKKYKSDVKLKVKRAVKAIKQDATNEEIEAVMQSGGVAKFVEQSILSDQPADVIRHAHQEVSDRYQDVLVLEASVAELHQMFLDFAVSTEKQGELLDQIEHQVGQAYEYIDVANKDLGTSLDLINKKYSCKAVLLRRYCLGSNWNYYRCSGSWQPTSWILEYTKRILYMRLKNYHSIHQEADLARRRTSTFLQDHKSTQPH